MTGGERSFRGGAMVGFLSASWPFASLTVSEGSLRLAAPVLGDHTLAPDEVVSVEPSSGIPILAWGVRIVHRRADIPERLVFYHFLPPSVIIDGIRATGFQASGRGLAKPDFSKTAGLPFRWPFLTFLVIAWNVLFLLDFARGEIPGIFSLLALWLVFLATVLVLHSSTFRVWVLKPGRELGYAERYVRFARFVVGTIAVAWSLLFLLAPDVNLRPPWPEG